MNEKLTNIKNRALAYWNTVDKTKLVNEVKTRAVDLYHRDPKKAIVLGVVAVVVVLIVVTQIAG